jgi:hypothetical protein
MRRMVGLVTIPISRFSDWVLWGLSRELRSTHGLRVASLESAALDDIVFSRLEAGLALLSERYPRALVTARRQIGRILILHLAGPLGLFQQYTRTMVFAKEFLHSQSATPLRVACVFVHEATHARLAARGVSYGPDTRVRHEVACMRAELRLLSALPPSDEGSALQVQLQRHIDDAPQIWSANAHIARNRAATAQLILQPQVRALIDRFGAWFHRGGDAV